MYMREEFAKRIDTDFIDLASLLVSYGLPTLDAIRSAIPKIRDYITDTMRLGDTQFRLMQLFLELFDTFPALHRNRSNAAQIEAIVIPARPAKYSIDMSALGGWPRPEQHMKNQISHRLYEAEATYPPYAPYIIPDVATEPWVRANPEYRKLDTGRIAKMRGKKFTKHPPIQAWALARIRFIPTPDLRGEFAPFGGDVAQLNAPPHFPRLSSPEGPPQVLDYESILRRRLGQFARGAAIIISITSDP